jgi:hypothetical protein
LILPLSGQDQPVSFVSRIPRSLASEVAFDRNVGKNGNPAESPAVSAVSSALSAQLRRNEAATNVSERSYFGRGLFAQRLQFR